MTEAPKKYPIVPPPLPFWQRILHIIVILLGWAIFFYFFWRAIIHGRPSTLEFITLALVISVVVFPLVSYSWIMHNINIYQEKGPRKATPYFPETYEKDFLGYPIVADWDKMKQAKFIRIKITEDEKIYEEEDLTNNQ